MSNKKTNKKTSTKKSQTTSKVEKNVEEKVQVEKKAETKEEKKNSKVSLKEQKIKKAKRQNLIKASIISLIVLVGCAISLIPLFKETKFGLDLQGGFEILYKVNSIDDSDVNSDMVNGTYTIMEKRINSLGVSEPEISIEGDNIRVQLAGVTNLDDARKMISTTAALSFRTIDGELLMDSGVLNSGKASVGYDVDKGYFISLSIKDYDKFYEQTDKVSKMDNNFIVIWLDYEEGTELTLVGNSYQYSVEEEIVDNEGNVTVETKTYTCGDLENSNCLSVAGVNQGFASDVIIEGNFEQEEANMLVELINSGSMPTKLEEISSRTVNASFGEDALQKTFRAGIIGIAAIMLLLIVIYHFSGFIAGIGVVAYTALVFLIFTLIGGRLTLPGIAAVIIGIGMAVDACVISFARIKEELSNKSTLEDAFKKGNKNSISSIMDANITTLIAAIILFVLGESSVKGFATMLIISIIVTILVMVLVVRWLLGMFIKSGYFNNHYRAFLGIKNLEKKSIFERFDYVKYLNKFVILTVIVLIAGGIYFFKNGFNLGIDFAGGSSISITSSNEIKESDIKKDIENLGYTIAKTETIDSNTVYITVKDVFEAADNEKTTTYFEEKYEDSTTSIGSVSNVVKKQLLENAIKSLVFACIGLIIYVTLRFTFNYGISSVAALIHDVVVVCILFSLLGLEVTTIYIAAILSIIGYSINNTIVVFDRIRENKAKLYKGKLKNKQELKDLVNTSLRETVSRTLLATITTLLPVVALIILGSHEIVNFNYALLFGLIAGSYSSLILATAIWLLFEKNKIGKTEKKKWYEVEDEDKVEELKVKGINC